METIREILSEDPVRVAFAVFATAVFYFQIVLLMRVSGKRALADMTTFDFVTNVSIGSILPSAIVTRGIAFWTGLAVVTALVGLQWFVTWLAVRSTFFESLISNPPKILLYEGQLQRANMRSERISEQQLRSTIRQHGFGDLHELHAVILETSGAFAVIRTANESGPLVAELLPASAESTRSSSRP